MFAKELQVLSLQSGNDIQQYKHILTRALNNKLVNCLKEFEHEILDNMRTSAKDGYNSFSIMLIPETIFKSPYTFCNTHAEFSLDYCINEYLFDKYFFGILKKQVKYTDINYKQFYKKLQSERNVNRLKILPEIIEVDSSIKNNLKKYYDQMELSVELIPNPLFAKIEISWCV